ncbi:1-aminocyclopropane-1-carboxylate deaminase/D-cysteine desulfhydrase [Undibacterium sp.]|jgi:1-aminocyclopropane-1-carboxylate deaminase|uniref:1-aminocyclopropane-1-carboxylate deaminase/D-cysteine desulfhydrase n=1 Tax=Undibacterium sp. TaxID=1914977 RepID=UPI002CF75567|nr:pyridoxal-phosphate dependent enzyme [Undibacterium sp.]HTD05150.1 pyridoxal-phosphate dependent enzyme [Undibacterium sp.]
MPLPISVSPCQLIPDASVLGRQVWVKRDDLLHAQVSGNKFRKLKYPLLQLQGKQATLVTMGGPWSNHLHALAHAAAMHGYPCLGLVRGPHAVDSATLDDCRRLGMQIRLVSREEYRALRDVPGQWRRHLHADDANGGEPVWLPEGGSCAQALHGVAELIDELPFIPDTMLVACGTGATLAGLLAGLRGRGRVLGIAVLKNAAYLREEIAGLLQQAGYPAYDNYELLTGYHHGGYAKATPELLAFCARFSVQTGIPVEPVYTGKMFHALQLLTAAGKFQPGESVLALHTGGLQGARGFALPVGTECMP